MRAPDFWYRPRGVAASALLPLSLFWSAGGAVQRLLAKPYRAQKPVICIGNIVAGGAGKTPTALAAGRLLQQNGHQPVFVTRGYGGSERGPLRVDSDRHSAREVGDEALLLARVAPTWIGCDRAAAIKEAEQHGSHIVLDDGLQNAHLQPDISFLVIDGESGFGNGCLIPAGPLRETLENALPRVAAVILIGERDAHGIAARIRCQLIRARLQPDLSDRFPRAEKFFAFAGIGQPQKFYTTCRAAGLTLAGSEDFPDHHVFNAGDLARLRQKSVALGARLLTTEKDWVRLPLDVRTEVTALPVKLTFEDSETVRRLLKI